MEGQAKPNDGQNQAKKKDKKPKNIVIPPKKPKLSKAERRAIQEEQRAAKGLKADNKKPQKGQGGGENGNNGKGQGDAKGSSSGGGGGKKDVKNATSSAVQEENKENKGSEKNLTHPFFSHLPPFKDHKKNQNFTGIKMKSNIASSANINLHPAVLALGLKYADGSIRGANSRCKAMLQAFRQVINDYTFPLPSNGKTKDFRHDLENRILKPSFTFWTTECRIHSVTMGNAFTFLKISVAKLDRDLKLEEVKNTLNECIEVYIEERIDFADKAICKHAESKITDGDVILTYAKNDLIQMLLSNINNATDEENKKNFRVILVDSRPLLEGKEMMKKLANAGIECTYILLNSLSYVMKEVTKVFLGASALMSNGSILSRVGTASVALMASSHNVPVLVCCETYKISNRVQLESITGNELGDPDGFNSLSKSANKDRNAGRESLRLLNLLYDLTPSEFVSGIVTEMGILPPTSVAVLLREMNPQESGFKEDDIC